jgi:hypothetical protein
VYDVLIIGAGPGPAAGLGDQNAIELACKAAPDEILHLEHLGVTFHRDGARAFGGASAARTFYVAGITGQALLHVLYEQLLKHEETVDRFEERFVTSLLRGDDGQVIDYAGVYKCCGFPIITLRKQLSLAQAGRHVGDAIDAHADCLVTPRLLCHLNLDMQQPLAAKTVGRSLGLPVLHLPELVGLALRLGMARHIVKATRVIDGSQAVIAAAT